MKSRVTFHDPMGGNEAMAKARQAVAGERGVPVERVQPVNTTSGHIPPIEARAAVQEAWYFDTDWEILPEPTPEPEQNPA